MVNKESVDLIRKYIIDREGKATKGEVVRYMQNDVTEPLRLSRDTTMKMIENMDNVIVLKGERRGQAHKLLIEDKKEFNRIGTELSDIESIVELMSEPMKKFMSIGGDNPDDIRRVPDRWILKELRDKFIEAYLETVGEMLEILLVEISNKIQSKKDAWSLYKKIIELKIKLSEQKSWFGGKGVEDMYLTSNAFIQFHSQDLEEITQENLKFAENNGIPINSLVKSLKLRIEDFRSRFLPYPDYPNWGKSNDNIFRVSDKESTDLLRKSP
jgi:hypothetical protein